MKVFIITCFLNIIGYSLQAQTFSTPVVGLEDGTVIQGTEVRLRTPPRLPSHSFK